VVFYKKKALFSNGDFETYSVLTSISTAEAHSSFFTADTQVIGIGVQGRESIPGLRKDSRPVALLSELRRTLMKFGDHHVTAFEAHHGLAQMGLRPSLLRKQEELIGKTENCLVHTCCRAANQCGHGLRTNRSMLSVQYKVSDL
jgi:hypothetical protein